jgi:hypothetical protein
MILSKASIMELFNRRLNPFEIYAKLDEEGDICLYERVRRIKADRITDMQYDYILICDIKEPSPVMSYLHVMKTRDSTLYREKLIEALSFRSEELKKARKESSDRFKWEVREFAASRGWYGRKTL